MVGRAPAAVVHRAALVALIAFGCSQPEARTPARAPAPGDACAARELPVAASERLEPASEPVSGRVAEVIVRGSKRVPAALVRRAITLEPGEPVDAERVARDVRAIHALEVFDDVSVRQRSTPRGVVVSYELTDRPLISGVRIRGDRAMAAELGLIAGTLYEPARIHQRARELEQSWARNGHARARVTLGGVRHAGGVELCATLEPGPRLTIERFEFAGAEVVAVHELRALMETDSGRINTPGGVYRKDVLARDLLHFAALHWDRGLLSVETRPLVEAAGDRLKITIQIEEGPVYRIGALSVSGARLAPGTEYLKLLGARKGNVFSRAELMAGLERISAFHRARGRPELDVTPETTLRRQQAEVDLKLVVGEP